MRAIGMALTVVLSAGGATAQTVRSWLAPTSGAWSVPVNWVGADVPDSPDEAALIEEMGFYTVTLDGALAIHSVSIPNATATLALRGGTSLVLTGPSLVNNGSIVVNSDRADADAVVRFDGSAALSGSGTLRFTHHGDFAQVHTGKAAQLTQMAGHTIAGGGRVHADLVNHGEVLADVEDALELAANPKMNHGTMRAIGDGVLSIDAPVTQSKSARIVADTGTVQLLAGGDVVGGAIEARNGGRLRFLPGASHAMGFVSVDLRSRVEVRGGGLASVENMENRGTVYVFEDGAFTISRSLNNTGVVSLFSAEDAAAELRFGDDGAPSPSIAGRGAIVLGGSGELVQLSTAPGARLIHGADHLIRGSGRITADLVNHGTILADTNRPLQLLTSPKINHGVIRGFGRILLATTLTQEGTGRIIADGGELTLHDGVSVTGGRIEAVSGGILRSGAGVSHAMGVVAIDVFSSASIDGTSSFDVVDNAGTLRVGATAVLAARSITTSGVVSIEIGESASGAIEADDADLAGEVDATVVEGFVPALNSTYTIMTAAARTGVFDRVRVRPVPGTNPVLAFRVAYVDGTPKAPGDRVELRALCLADWNADMVVDSRDFFEYLAAFFDGDRGDANADGATTSQDLFDFLASFFTCGL